MATNEVPAPGRRVDRTRDIERYVFLCFVLIVVGGYSLTRPLQDFVEYWTSAHLFVSGKNPYSVGEVSRYERALGWAQPTPLMNPTPPWTLPLIAPLAFVKSYSMAWVLWVGTLTMMVFFSSRQLLDLYAKGRRVFRSESYWSEAAIGFTFVPVLYCLKFTQITPFVLLGIASFLHFQNRNRPILAGLSMTLAAVKPHLVYLLFASLVLSIRRKESRIVLFSLLLTVAALSAISAAVCPGVIHDYLEFSRSGYLKIWPSAIGALLRLSGSAESFRLQFLAPLIGGFWLLCYWEKLAKHWDWRERMPMLITVSVLTTAYGWIFDQVLLLVPIIALSAALSSADGKIARQPVIWYSVLNFALIFGTVLSRTIPFVLAPLALIFTLWRVSPTPGTERMAADAGYSV